MPTGTKTATKTGLGQQADEYLRGMRGKPAAQLRSLIQRDYHTCDCEMPYIERKWNDALGVFTEIRLCCLAKAVQELTGIVLYEVFEFQPVWEWNCNDIVIGEDGTRHLRGCPPKFMLERFAKRNIRVMHGDTPHREESS